MKRTKDTKHPMTKARQGFKTKKKKGKKAGRRRKRERGKEGRREGSSSYNDDPSSVTWVSHLWGPQLVNSE